MRKIAAFLCAMAFAVPAVAGDKGDPPKDEEPRVFSIVVYGEDACPKAEGDDIVVCARRPEGERYRIPKDVRRTPETVGSQGWGSTVANIEADARKLLPGSCTVIGSNGQSGCTRAMLQQWFAERRLEQQERAGKP